MIISIRRVKPSSTLTYFNDHMSTTLTPTPRRALDAINIRIYEPHWDIVIHEILKASNENLDQIKVEKILISDENLTTFFNKNVSYEVSKYTPSQPGMAIFFLETLRFNEFYYKIVYKTLILSHEKNQFCTQ